MSRPRLIALMLALVTLVVYLPVNQNGFLLCDDDDYVTNNPVVEQGLTPASIKWAFTTFHSANWHPLTWLSLMLDSELFQLNAGAFHLVNVLFHAANTALLFLLFWRLTGLGQPAVLVAALFAWHPMHVESVAWVAERKDVLSTFFGLLALLSFATFARENCRRSYWLALLFFVLSLLAKPMLVTLPFLLLLLDFWPLQRLSSSALWPLLREKIPFFALAAASCVVTFIAQHTGHAVVTLDLLPLRFRLENPPVSAMQYVLKILWPTNLAFFYPYQLIPTATLVLAVVTLPLISVAVWLARTQNRCWLTGWLWFLGTLVPVIGFVQVGGASMADRYTYIPSIGIFAAVAFGLYGLDWSRKIFPFLAAVPLIACVLVTEKQLGYWRDTETLVHHTIEVTRNNHVAYCLLAASLDREGKLAEAVAAYHDALQANPRHYQLHVVAGDAFMKLGQPAEALAEYRQAISQESGNAAYHNAAGCALAAQGNFAAAVPEFTEAERLLPHYPQPHLELAKGYFKQGTDDQAVAELWAAVRVGPDDCHALVTVARYLAANTNAAARDEQSAVILALEARDLADAQQQSEVFDVLGMAFAATGNFSDASMCAQKALEFAPAAKVTDTQPMQSRLELYQKHQPWLESFGATNNTPL